MTPEARKIIRNALENIAYDHRPSEPFKPDANCQMCGYIKEALAALDADEVGGMRSADEWAEEYGICGIEDVIRAIQQDALAHAQKVQTGWKLVPVEATEEMIKSGVDEQDEYHYEMHHLQSLRIYKAMLSAAPNPPKEGEL